MISSKAKKTFSHIPENLFSVTYFKKGNYGMASRELVILERAFQYLENHDEYYIYPIYTIGGEKHHIQIIDYETEMIEILAEWILDNEVPFVFDIGNNSPIRSKLGNYIRIMKLG